MKTAIVSLFLLASMATFAQNRFDSRELSVNGFRNPSIGLEYRVNHLSAHAGYYVTNFESGITTEFIKTGVTYWFLPMDQKEIPSSFYAGASYLRGLTRDYENKNGVALEAGFRWMIWKGLNFRIGAIALAAPGESIKINPTPGLSYSLKF
jgi:hypothetical protein